MKRLKLMLAIISVFVMSGAMGLKADDAAAVPAPTPVDPMAQVNAAIAENPDDPVNYIVRGNIYSQHGIWGEAQSNYEKALEVDPHNSVAKMDLAEILFRQKSYDEARVKFVALQGDADLGDLASYMAFVCDLVGGHEEAAGKELAIFNAAGENASYYFGNMAWDLVHHDKTGARSYLMSASHIYPSEKGHLYTVGLEELGYLPLKN